MQWNPIEITWRLWAVKTMRPFVVTAWFLWGILLVGMAIFGANTLIVDAQGNGGLPVLATLRSWSYFGWLVLVIIVVAVPMGMVLAFKSAITRPIEITSEVSKVVIAQLRDLRGTGVGLLNEVQYQITSLQELVNWFPKQAAWRKDVVDLVKQIDQIWAGRIEILNRFKQNQATVANPVQGLVRGIEHQRRADMMNEALTRLEAFLDIVKLKPTSS